MASAPNIAHRVHYPDLGSLVGAAPPGGIVVEGDEAHHAARVKRLREGDLVGLFDGRGLTSVATVDEIRTGKRASLALTIDAIDRHEPVQPRVEVWCPPPKSDRLDTMIDQLSQLGVAAWRPLRTQRSERDAFRADKLERVAVESAKQCGRAWLIEIGDWIVFDDAAGDPRAMLADASGVAINGPATSDAVLLLGPEGGWAGDELERFRATGKPLIRFGPHVMRIETAAVAGAACLLSDASQGDPA